MNSEDHDDKCSKSFLRGSWSLVTNFIAKFQAKLLFLRGSEQEIGHRKKGQYRKVFLVSLENGRIVVFHRLWRTKNQPEV